MAPCESAASLAPRSPHTHRLTLRPAGRYRLEAALRGHGWYQLAPHDWDLVGATCFCFTAATTIGYGNYTPTTDAGKLFLVFYSLVAIPACLRASPRASRSAATSPAVFLRDLSNSGDVTSIVQLVIFLI